MPDDHEELLKRFSNGDRRALARLLTLAELGQTPVVPQERGPMLRVGLTGSGGAGKSTLAAALIRHLRSLGKRVAVLANDPQSPVSGGALLGDRVRASFDPADEGVYFRSLSTRGAAGGIAAATEACLAWLAAFGFDVAIVETVGVGQDQIAVRPLVEVLVLVVTPAGGDEVQWEKAGLIELADLVVVNKSDLTGADRVRQQLHTALTLVPGAREVPVLSTVASSGKGLAELWAAIEAASR